MIFPRGCFIKSSTEWSVKGEQTSAEYTAGAAGIQNKNTAVLWIAPSLGNRGRGGGKVNGTRYQITRNSSRCPLRWQPGKYERSCCHDLKIWSLSARKKNGDKDGDKERVAGGEARRGENNRDFSFMLRANSSEVARLSIKRSARASPMSSNKNLVKSNDDTSCSYTRVTEPRKNRMRNERKLLAPRRRSY